MRKTHEDILGSLTYGEEILIQIRGRNYKRFSFAGIQQKTSQIVVTLRKNLLTYIDMKDITGVKIPND